MKFSSWLRDWGCLFFSSTAVAQTHPLFTYLTQFSHFIIQVRVEEGFSGCEMMPDGRWAVGVAVVIRMRNPALGH